jgi:hypothetical protein
VLGWRNAAYGGVQESLLDEIARQGGRVFSTSAGEQEVIEDDPDDPSRRLIRQVLAAVSEYEREIHPRWWMVSPAEGQRLGSGTSTWRKVSKSSTHLPVPSPTQSSGLSAT